MLRNKKGLASGLFVIISVLFILAVINVFTLSLWNEYTSVINDTDNATVPSHVKEKIFDYNSVMHWGDKIFIYTFLMLLVLYIITARTLPSDRPEIIFVFLGLLIILCVLAMIFTNAFDYITGLDYFISDPLDDFTLTAHFMKWLPVYTFFTGIAGALIFYSKRNSSGGGVYNGE